jgi:hypothetical protein
MGLNDPTHLSDSVHKYYGEPYMAQLGLAPNAIVLLGNLCYASGNSEPGGTAPTVSVARQRIDNYAAGFLKGGARAVIADGHGGLVSYIRGLFTSSRTILDLWRSVPNYHGHETAFASSRSPGYTAYSDPDTTSGGYYRSLVTKPTITTTGRHQCGRDTGLDPASLVVPGRGEVAAAETPLLASATLAGPPVGGHRGTPDVPVGTRLKTIAVGLAATASTPALIQVQGLDDPSITGFVAANDLTPRGQQGPGRDRDRQRPRPVLAERRRHRRHDQGRHPVLRIGRAGPSRSGTAAVRFSQRIRAVVASRSSPGMGSSGANGSPMATYAWTVRGIDAWQNGTGTATGSLVVDTSAPSITSITPDGSVVNQFSPNAGRRRRYDRDDGHAERGGLGRGPGRQRRQHDRPDLHPRLERRRGRRHLGRQGQRRQPSFPTVSTRSRWSPVTPSATADRGRRERSAS